MLFIYYLVLSLVNSLSVRMIPETGNPPSQREFSGFAIAGTSSKKLYIYGGYSESFTKDMWEFDLTTSRWQELYPTSILTPGPRSQAFITTLQSQNKILLFGGNTESGPVSDLWLYDIENQSVRFIQWRAVDDKGSVPIRAYYRSVCYYIHEGKEYLAVYGGLGKYDVNTALYILDIASFTWAKLQIFNSEADLGNFVPYSTGQQITYKDGKLYIWGSGGMVSPIVSKMYVFNIQEQYWSVLDIKGTQLEASLVYGFCGYEDSLYVMNGFDRQKVVGYKAINKLNLNKLEWERYDVQEDEMAFGAFGYVCDGSMIYLFGGFENEETYNNIWSIDLSQNKLKWNMLGRRIKVPTARSGHAMQVYDDKLFIFGGQDKYGNMLIDIWTFDLQVEDWSKYYTVSNISPTPRSDFASTRNGEIIIIFGGRTDTITIGDMYTLNLRTKEWKLVEVTSTINPTPRYGACMGSAGGYIFIFGGITDKEYTNELWLFDPGSSSYTLLETAGKEPPVSARGSCKAYLNEVNEIIFESYMGDTKNGNPTSSVYRYNHSTKSWLEVRPAQYDLYVRTAASAYIMNDFLLVAGGREWEYIAHNDAFVLDLKNPGHEAINKIMLPDFSYNAASVFYKNKLYIQGGAASFGYLPLHNIPKNNLIVIEIDDDCEDIPGLCEKNCSKGTFYSEDSCRSCPVGTFTEETGSEVCKVCSIGQYSDTKGADSSRFCKPCDYGYYTRDQGQSLCAVCPSDQSCFVDLYGFSPESNISHSLSSEQPDLMDNYELLTEVYTNYFNLFLSIISTLFIILLLCFSKTRIFVSNLDMFSTQHNYEENESMTIRKTFMGGLASIVFLLVAMSVVFSMSMSQGMNNITETKALVPLVALEHEYENFQSQELRIEVIFHEYGGFCVKHEDLCADSLRISPINFYGQLISQRCKKESSDCYIYLKYSNFELISTGSLSLEIDEQDSYASKISISLSSSSSIPNEFSKISTSISSIKNMYFRGSSPTVFTLLMTPSLFLNDSGDWDNELTGYHVSEVQDPERGSHIAYSEISFVKNLKVRIELQKNSAALLTQRLIKQSLISFFSNLAGSVLGIMGLIGFIMNIIEPNYDNFMKRNRSKQAINYIIQNGIHIQKVNFEPLTGEYVNCSSDHKKFEKLDSTDNILHSSLQDQILNESNLGLTNDIQQLYNHLSYNEATGIQSCEFKRNKIVPYED